MHKGRAFNLNLPWCCIVYQYWSCDLSYVLLVITTQNYMTPRMTYTCRIYIFRRRQNIWLNLSNNQFSI